jgi:hypothetical protein
MDNVEKDNNEEIETEIQELKEEIEDLAKITKDNNTVLRRIQQQGRLSLFVNILYWMVIIGSMFGAYYYLQPFIGTFKDKYDQLINIPQKIQQITTQPGDVKK